MNVVVEGGEGGGKYNKLPNASNVEEKNENIQTIFYLTISDILYVPFLYHTAAGNICLDPIMFKIRRQ